MTDFTKGPQPDPADPYRYGPPAVPARGQTPTGKQILTSSWRLLKQDRELIALPVLGTLFGLVAFAILFTPGLLIAIGAGDPSRERIPIYLFGVLGGFAASVVGIFFQAALVVGAYQRADGGDPTLGSALAGAWTLKRQILGWALLTTIVGSVIRAVEQRLGILGRILGFLGGLAWAIATFFVVPIIVAHGIGPIDAVKRSTATIKQMWGTSVRTTLRFGLIQFVLMIVPLLLIVAGIAVLSSGGAGGIAGGITLAAVGAVLLIGLGIVFGAVATYARAMIYRWTIGAPVPGMDPQLFAGAFAPKRRRGRR